MQVVLLTEKRGGNPDINTLSNLSQLANDLQKGAQEVCNWVNRGYTISEEDKLPEVDPTFSRLNEEYGCQEGKTPVEEAPPPAGAALTTDGALPTTAPDAAAEATPGTAAPTASQP